MKTYTCVYLCAAILSLGITPLVARLARTLRLMDYPGTRKVHSEPVPRVGGVAIFLAILGATIPVMILDNIIGEAARSDQARILTLLAGSVFMLALGLFDDVHDLRARTKLVMQIAAALGMCAMGIRIDRIAVGQWFVLEWGRLAWPVTILWIVGITNALNLIDGLDGLAAGIAAVAAGVIAVLAISTGQLVMGVLMLALLGSLSGFLVFNFNPARVFLGNSGTLFIGFVIGVSSVMNAAKSATLVGLAIPALALGVPIFDMLASILRRVLERRSIFAPDRSHIHHRLIAMGLRQRHAVLIMYAVTVLAAALGMLMLVTHGAGRIVVFGSVMLLLVLLFRSVGSVRLRESLASLRRNHDIAREARGQQSAYESAALWVREVRTFDGWWEAICTTAEQMEFVCLSMTLESGDGTSQCVVWRHPKLGAAAPGDVVQMAFPMRKARGTGAGARIQVEVWTNGSLESAGRRAALFGRLIDEHGPPRPGGPFWGKQPQAARGAPSEPDAGAVEPASEDRGAPG